VGVGISRQRDAGAPEDLRHDFDRYASGESQAGGSMPKVVQTDTAQPWGLARKLGESVRDLFRRQMSVAKLMSPTTPRFQHFPTPRSGLQNVGGIDAF
jgi:hypothetical protein